MEKKLDWYQRWFNDDYLKIYSHRDQKEAENFIFRLVKMIQIKKIDRILDVACGTGRHIIPLAKKGFNVTGIDLSQCLLGYAKKQSSQDNLSINFHLMDMRDLSQLGKFDVVLNLFTSFGYFETDEENQKALQEMTSVLNNDGKFILDYLNPDYVIKNLIQIEEKNIDNQKIIIKRRIIGDFIIKDVIFPGKEPYRECIKLYRLIDLKKFIDLCGLKLITSWGDYEFQPLKKASPRQILYCRKKSSRGD